MDSNLVVIRPFGQYARGDVIADPAAIQRVLASESAGNVVRVLIPAQPAPQKEG